MKNLIYILLVFFVYKSQAKIAILNGLTHQHKSIAGGTVTGKITVENQGKKEARLILYLQDLVLECQKEADYAELNSHSRSSGSWLKTNVNDKSLAPGEVYDVLYTITIPQDLKTGGSYWAEIMVENADPVVEQKQNKININSKVRYAVNIISDIGVYNSPKLTLDDATYSADTNKVVRVNIKNNGSFVSKTKVQMEVFNKTGDKVKVYEGDIRRIYPDRCSVFMIKIKDLPKGSYEGIIMADNGTDIFGANLSLLIE